jgi:hypothetical protein
MPFKLINDSAIYQYFINNVLFNCFDKFAFVYFDNILIYNENLKKHRWYVWEILERLKKARL